MGHFAMQIFGEFFGRLATLQTFFGRPFYGDNFVQRFSFVLPRKKQKKMGRSWDRIGFSQLGCAVGDSVIR